MDEDRWKALTDDDDLELTADEIAKGWHFCHDWDGLLIGPGMGEMESCQCLAKALAALCDDPETDDVHQPFTAFNQGWTAAEYAMPESANPYEEDTIEWLWWNNGWKNDEGL